MGKHKREHQIKVYHEHHEIRIPEVDKVIADYYHEVDIEPDGDVERRFPEDDDDIEDRIGNLPDEVLQFIISLLTMREGAATSILSRRWRNLWTKSTTHLEFNDYNLFGYEYPKNIFELKEKARREEERRYRNKSRFPQPRRKGVVETERTRFVNHVNQILAQRSASRMDKFMVRFPLGTESATHIDTWMKLAAAQRVRKLKLALDWTYYDNFDWKPSKKYTFHVRRFASSLKHLCVQSCVFNFPSHFGGLSSLAYLDLCGCSLTSGDVQNLLTKCPSLKFLSLSTCVFPVATILEFVGPSIPIKHLHISDTVNIEQIKLQDLNLLCCELMVYHEKISIENLRHVIKLMLHTEGNMEILGSFPRLETLILKHRCSFLGHKLPDLSALSKIKCLAFCVDEMVSNLFEVVFLLKTFPLLQIMEIDMGDFTGGCLEQSRLSRRVATTPGCSHSNLKEVVISAFESHPELIDLTKYLLKNAIVLEKMKIHTPCMSYLGNGLWSYTEVGKLVGTALKEVSQLLKRKARPSTKILIWSK